MRFLISLTENDKRILIAIGLLFILVFVIVGYIALIVERVMKHQAKKVGIMMHNVVAAKVITTPRSFVKFGRKKNNRLFFKQSWIPFLILLFALFIYILYGAITRNWGLNIFDYKKVRALVLFYLYGILKIRTFMLLGSAFVLLESGHHLLTLHISSEQHGLVI